MMVEIHKTGNLQPWKAIKLDIKVNIELCSHHNDIISPFQMSDLQSDPLCFDVLGLSKYLIEFILQQHHCSALWFAQISICIIKILY